MPRERVAPVGPERVEATNFRGDVTGRSVIRYERALRSSRAAAARRVLISALRWTPDRRPFEIRRAPIGSRAQSDRSCRCGTIASGTPCSRAAGHLCDQRTRMPRHAPDRSARVAEPSCPQGSTFTTSPVSTTCTVALAEGPVSSEPVSRSNSLLTGKFTGNLTLETALTLSPTWR